MKQFIIEYNIGDYPYANEYDTEDEYKHDLLTMIENCVTITKVFSREYE